jgi:hypothetical protein
MLAEGAESAGLYGGHVLIYDGTTQAVPTFPYISLNIAVIIIIHVHVINGYISELGLDVWPLEVNKVFMFRGLQ